jgi:hypothetical protein
MRRKLRRGDFVRVRNPEEILNTLDADGALDHLPFMPEMVQFCGKRFRVARRALTVCFSGPEGPRAFDRGNVVTLEDIRCSGLAHDGCQKACMIFWHESWLEKLDGTGVENEEETTAAGLVPLSNSLKIAANSHTYFCQASELSRATSLLPSRSAKMKQWFRGLLAGNFTIIEMARSFSIQLFWSIRRLFWSLRGRVLGLYPWGIRRLFWAIRRHVLGSDPCGSSSSPGMSLGLRPGDWVRVKSLESIVQTLDERWRNRGLQFTLDMRRWCGRKLRVGNRLDKIVVDGTGAMRVLRDTVCLEGVTCGCAYLGLAGCSRCELTYWREAWLEPCQPPGQVGVAPSSPVST